MKTMRRISIGALIGGVVFAMTVMPVAAQSSDDEVAVEELQQQLEELQQQIEQLREQQGDDNDEDGVDDNATSTEPSDDEEGSATSSEALEEGGPPSADELPEQASDRAKQVMECLELGRTLRSGDAGSDVEDIQEFLKQQGYFDYQEATGYYGSLTEEAVKEFQAEEGIVNQGSPETTGYGQVGPQTRAALAQSTCLRQTAPGQQAQHNEEADSSSADGDWEGDRGRRPDHAGPPSESDSDFDDEDDAQGDTVATTSDNGDGDEDETSGE